MVATMCWKILFGSWWVWEQPKSQVPIDVTEYTMLKTDSNQSSNGEVVESKSQGWLDCMVEGLTVRCE